MTLKVDLYRRYTAEFRLSPKTKPFAASPLPEKKFLPASTLSFVYLEVHG